MFIATKIMVFLLVFAILIVLREILSLYIEIQKPDGHYAPSNRRLILLGVAISYIFTIIFTGFKLL